MIFAIGIILIVASSVLFTVLLPTNSPWMMLASPFFAMGFGLVCSKIKDMEDDIHSLEEKLNERNKK